MTLRSVNPANGRLLKELPGWEQSAVNAALAQSQAAAFKWAGHPIATRAEALRRLAQVLRKRKEELARLMTLEMGKLLIEARAEVEKCAWACDHYAEHGAQMLADEPIDSDGRVSLVTYQPLGTVLAIMPWNFPLWQVLRCAVPALTAGNTVVLKHAANVPQCALAVEALFSEAGFPEGVFRSLLITAGQVAQVIRDPRVHAVSLTGSEAAGRQVAAVAGEYIKKTVLELGGSDAFIVLDDADLEKTVDNAVSSRFVNAGQSCIAAKRFIVMEAIAETFLERLHSAVSALRSGDPLHEDTTLAPLARQDLRENLHEQVTASIARGALPVCGCARVDGPGFFYQPSILDGVSPGMPAYDQELFGPVAALIRARDEEDALRVANDSRYGLGGSVWSADTGRAERLARRLQCGCAFVNGMVKSDPRLPFGGIKASGYGRELSTLGVREFVNAKTLWIG